MSTNNTTDERTTRNVLFKKNDMELGAIEFKLKDGDTEELREKGFKLPFLLYRMLNKLKRHYPTLNDCMTTSGFFINDHKMQACVMDAPAPSLFRISREDLYTFLALWMWNLLLICDFLPVHPIGEYTLLNSCIDHFHHHKQFQ
jgi:hypothetical protein